MQAFDAAYIGLSPFRVTDGFSHHLVAAADADDRLLLHHEIVQGLGPAVFAEEEQIFRRVLAARQDDRIGTGQVAGEDYMRGSTEAVKAVSPETQVLQAAGIHSGANVYDAIKYGADGTGGTSGIVAAEDPFATLDEMFEALYRARTDFCKED